MQSSSLLRLRIVLFFLAAGTAGAQNPLRINLRQAVEMGLNPQGSPQIRIAEQTVRQVESRSVQQRAALLPQISGAATFQDRTTNLQAMGIRINIPIPGFQIPQFVGPFGYFDARVYLQQNVLDFGVIRRYQAARTAVGEARLEQESLRDQVAAVIARAYVNVIAADESVRVAKANLDLGNRLERLARQQKEAGTGIAVEVTRAQVQVANQKQALLVAQDQRRRAGLELLRAMGTDLSTEVEVAPLAPSTTQPPAEPSSPIETALSDRPDLKAQLERQHRLDLQFSAVKWERLPALKGFADYGSLGNRVGNSLPTRSFGVSLQVPIWDGGRMDARRAESFAQWQQERVKTEDLKSQIELEVRTALDSLRSAIEQRQVAEEGLALAERELEQATRRYEAGVTNSVEVTDAQVRLERARQNNLGAIIQYSLARVEFGRATGTIRRTIEQEF